MWNVLSPRPKRPQARVLDGVRVYAIADLHGCADLLAHVFSRIDADLASHPSSETFEVFLGDYVDRGPNSKGVIELLIKRACDRRTIFLAGNHEIYLSEFLRNPAVFDSWKQYGALLTLRSYGIRAPTNSDPNKQSELSLALKRSMPQSHQNFLDKLKPFFTCGDYFFVHAAFGREFRCWSRIQMIYFGSGKNFCLIRVIMERSLFMGIRQCWSQTFGQIVSISILAPMLPES